MKETNYYFNIDSTSREYTHSAPANKGSLSPEDALRIPPPANSGNNWPCEKDGAWILVEDHRQKKTTKGEVIKGTGTPYWLPVDDSESEARYMTTVGSLPKDALLTKPTKYIDFDKALNNKLFEINKTRDIYENGGFIYDGSIFDSDSVSIQRLTGANMKALRAINDGKTFTKNWTLKDNSIRVIHEYEFPDVIDALEERVEIIHAHATALKVKVRECESISEIEKINWTTYTGYVVEDIPDNT